MIKIIKNFAPENLINKGTIELNSDLEKFNLEKEKYTSGELKFEAKDSIYNSDNVRESLENIQKNKCCYCETKSTRSNIDVEHFRPKRAYSNTFNGESLYPGYFWLAYNWENLFLACQVCNQIFKNDFFPIEFEENRAQLNDLSIEKELPLLVHPSNDNPESEIGYIESIPVGKTEKGKRTIAYLGFGSVEHGKEFGINYSKKHIIRIARLVEEREKFYREKELVYKAIKTLESKELIGEELQTLNALQQLINNAQESYSEWSLMIRCAVEKEFKFY